MPLPASALPLVLAGVLALGPECGSSPGGADAQSYVEQMKPLLARNMEISAAFLDVAGAVKKKEIDAPRIRERMEKEIVPAATALASDVDEVDPATPALDDAHGKLADAWDHRAAAYRALLDAYGNNDVSGFEKAADANLQARLEEEKYFAAVNRVLEPHGLSLDQFPDRKAKK